jgi:hypothetical protein
LLTWPGKLSYRRGGEGNLAAEHEEFAEPI